MEFVPMAEDEIKRILEGAEDVLLPKATMGPRTCPFCKGAIQPMASRLGIVVLRCIVCGAEIDPESGLITRTGSSLAGKDIEVRMVQPSSDTTDGQPSDGKRHQS